MAMKTTSGGSKKFTTEEKLAILSEAKEKGVKVTLEKYGLYPATYYYWKKNIHLDGTDGFDHEAEKANRARIRELEKEVQLYKILLAEEQMKSRPKDELLKKKYPELKK